MRRAGIHEPRDSGRGRVLDEPILVSCSGAAVRGAGEVYDQHGRLLATGAKHREEGQRRFGLGENVIEIDDAMPEKLRHVMLAASEAISHLERLAAA